MPVFAPRHPATLVLWATLVHAALCGANAIAAPPVATKPLADPTQPPTSLAPARTTGLPPGGAAPVRAAVEPRAVPQLQAVQVQVQGASTALVDGRLVRVGDRLGDRVIQSIDQHGLVLRSAQRGERLWLLGASGKQLPGTLGAAQTTHYVAVPVAPAPTPPMPPATTPVATAVAAAASAPTAALTLAGRPTP